MPNNAYDDVMSGTRDNNIKFLDLRYVMESRGFFCRIKGDHYIYYRSDIPDIVPVKCYQPPSCPFSYYNAPEKKSTSAFQKKFIKISELRGMVK